jgi:hypothetical protein
MRVGPFSFVCGSVVPRWCAPRLITGRYPAVGLTDARELARESPLKIAGVGPGTGSGKSRCFFIPAKIHNQGPCFSPGCANVFA